MNKFYIPHDEKYLFVAKQSTLETRGRMGLHNMWIIPLMIIIKKKVTRKASPGNLDFVDEVKTIWKQRV